MLFLSNEQQQQQQQPRVDGTFLHRPPVGDSEVNERRGLLPTLLSEFSATLEYLENLAVRVCQSLPCVLARHLFSLNFTYGSKYPQIDRNCSLTLLLCRDDFRTHEYLMIDPSLTRMKLTVLDKADS